MHHGDKKLQKLSRHNCCASQDEREMSEIHINNFVVYFKDHLWFCTETK